MSVARALVVLVALAGVAGASPGDPGPIAHHRTARWIAVGAGLGLYVSAISVGKNVLRPVDCRWCSVDAIDAAFHNQLTWDNRSLASTLSTVSGYVAVPAGMAGLLYLTAREGPDPWLELSDDVLAAAEAAIYGQLIVQVIKVTTGRERPYAHYPRSGVMPSTEDNLSFPSGHTSIAFSIATAAGVMAHARHSRYEAAVWIGGMGLAAATAYFRIAAERHYLSDVIAGGAIGAAAGLVFPRLLGALPVDVVPTGTGVALTGAF